jgi:uncharacterized membrane protein YphA (DoxX/SURF4 family)
MNMKMLTKIGRIIFAIPFAVFGINHFINSEPLAGLYNTFITLVPFTNFLVGAALLAAAVSIILNRYIKLSCLLLAALLLIFILTIHVPQLFFNYAPETLQKDFGRMLILTNLLKDFALMGASLIIAGLSPANDNKIENSNL